MYCFLHSNSIIFLQKSQYNSGFLAQEICLFNKVLMKRFLFCAFSVLFQTAATECFFCDTVGADKIKASILLLLFIFTLKAKLYHAGNLLDCN